MKKLAKRESGISINEADRETALILGRSPDVGSAPETTIEPKFRTYYERLLNIRNDLVNQHTGWREQELETQPKDRQQADAESATTVAMRDAALGRVQGYERLEAEPWTPYSIAGQHQSEARGSSAITFSEGSL